jgi:hypothetical protein
MFGRLKAAEYDGTSKRPKVLRVRRLRRRLPNGTCGLGRIRSRVVDRLRIVRLLGRLLDRIRRVWRLFKTGSAIRGRAAPERAFKVGFAAPVTL